jgi:hypothetical protein
MANYPKNISSTTPVISPPAWDGSGDNGNQGGDICPSSKPVAPQREVENSAQKSCSRDDRGGSGDFIIHLSNKKERRSSSSDSKNSRRLSNIIPLTLQHIFAVSFQQTAMRHLIWNG